MVRLPVLSPVRLAKALERIGFQKIRTRGSHMFFKHPDGRTTVVPNHPGEKIDRGLLNKIIKRDLKMSREEFLQFL